MTRALPPPVPAAVPPVLPPIPAAPSVKGQPAPQLSPDPTATCPTSSLRPQSRTRHMCSLPVLWLTFDSLKESHTPPHPADRPWQGLQRPPPPFLAVSRGLSAAWDKATLMGAPWSPPLPPHPSGWLVAQPCCPSHSSSPWRCHEWPCHLSITVPAQAALPAACPNLASTPPEHKVVLRPQDPPRGLWGGLSGERPAGTSSHLPRIRPVTAVLWESSPCSVVRMKPVPQRGQKHVCGARPQFQTTRTFLRPHPPKEPFPQKHLPCSKRPLLPTPHAPRVLEGESADVAKDSVLGTRGPGPGAPKKKTFQELSLLPRDFYRCPLLTFPPKK